MQMQALDRERNREKELGRVAIRVPEGRKEDLRLN
jgi:hypothetical protein